jgi:hypothetical protein
MTILADYLPVKVAGADKTLPTPVIYANSESKSVSWGDNSAKFAVSRNAGYNINSFDIDTGKGWGAGISFAPPPNSTHTNQDGSADLSGARKVLVRFRADFSIKFLLGINESGHSPPGAQTYQGEKKSDGESYLSWGPMTGTGTPQELVFNLEDFSRNRHYGNQRGNNSIDTAAVAELQIFFPGPAVKGSFSLESIIFE